MNKKVYQEISSCLIAINNCDQTGNHVWYDNHRNEIERIVRNYMPSGSGIDTGTSFDFETSKPDKLVFSASYHRINDGGYYCNWIDFQIIVKPSLAFGFDIKIKGQFSKYPDIREYLIECYQYALDCTID